MEGEIETVKVDIHGKIICAVQDRERECLLEVTSEAESWIDQVKRGYESGKYKDRKTSPGVSIYRVPECIKKNKREAYDPVVVCLGPYHHKKHQQLTAVDEYKFQAVNRTLERLQAADRTLQRLPGMTIEGLVSEVKNLENEIRVCYEDSAAEWDGETLAWIMTMDACFILEFIRMDLPDSSLVFDPQRSYNIKRQEIMLDIMKLENQIPFCILKKILELSNEPVRDFAKKLFNTREYFRGYPCLPRNQENPSSLYEVIEGDPHHLLDLSRRVITGDLDFSVEGSCQPSPEKSKVKGSLIPSAEKLKKAGIKLKANPEAKFCFQPGCFNCTLLVPQIDIHDDTEILLRNLVAFEECHKHSPIKRVISGNMCIMDELIDSKEDVKLFQRADIIKNYLGNEDEVAKIFNDLCIGVSDLVAEDEYRPLLKMVNDHYKSQLNVWIHEFKEQHCSRPWYIVSFVVAVLLLVMTFLQTIYTMKR